MKENVALITGGAGCVGRELASKLSASGAHLAIVDKYGDEQKDYFDSLAQEHGIKYKIFPADLGDKAAFSEIKEGVEGAFGQLDYIVNAAAFYDEMPGWGVDFEEESFEAWEAVLKVNLMAPFFMVQTLYPLLKKAKAPAVVNVSSIYGIVGPDHSLYEGTAMTNPCVYAASKSGMNQVTKWLATVLAPKVRVNTVSPGGIERGQAPVFIERYKKKTLLDRMCTEKDVANAIHFLLSDASAYINAQNIVVDGGWTAW